MQSPKAGPVLARVRLVGAGAAAPLITSASGGDDGGILSAVARSAAGTYLLTFKFNCKADGAGLPRVSVTSQFLDEGAANPPDGWTLTADRSTVDTNGFAQVEIRVFDETQALADLDSAAFLDLLFWLDGGVV